MAVRFKRWLAHLLHASERLESIAAVHFFGNSGVGNVRHVNEVDIFFVLQHLLILELRQILVMQVVVVYDFATDLAELTLAHGARKHHNLRLLN